MSGAPRQWPPGGRPRHRSESRKRGEPIVRNADESLQGDACVPLGNVEGRVHGGHPFSAISPIPARTDGQRKLPTRPLVSPVEQDDDESLWVWGDACFHGGWVTAVLGDSQGPGRRVHGGSAMSPFCTGPSVLPPSSSSGFLKIPMSALAMEFCNIKIWRIDKLKDHLGITPGSIWESVRRSCSSSSHSDSAASCPTSSGSFTGTNGSSNNDASFKTYLLALNEDMSVRSDKAFSRTDFIDRKMLSILNDIAGIMIERGHEKMLRRSIDRQSAQLASHIEILDINSILGSHKEESKEILLKAWTTAIHIIAGFLSEMQRQLNAQDLGYFNRLKEDYFLAIAKHSVMKLLKAASSICIQGPSIDPVYKDTDSALKPDLSKMVNVVMMYQTLNYVMPTILALFSGETKEFIILKEAEGLIHRLSDMFVKLAVEQNDLVRSQRLDISDTGVHRSTRQIMDHMRMLVQHKSSVYLILKGNPKAFCELVLQLISSLEFMLDMNSRNLQLQGQQQIFLLNNAHFMLQEVKDNDLGMILGEGWLLQRHDQLNLFMTGYVDASWTPVMSCFQRRTRVPEILWPQQLLDKFTSSFEMTYRVQKTWKVTDPLIRHKVREAIFQKVIPEYRMHMENYSEKKQKSARYSIEQLESQLQELFEG